MHRQWGKFEAHFMDIFLSQSEVSFVLHLVVSVPELENRLRVIIDDAKSSIVYCTLRCVHTELQRQCSRQKIEWPRTYFSSVDTAAIARCV